MSVVVQDCNSEKIYVFCKGADSIIMPLLDQQSHHNFSIKDKTEEFLEDYAQDGLRTLLLAERELDMDWYKDWNQRYEEAAQDLTKRESAIEEVVKELEVKL